MTDSYDSPAARWGLIFDGSAVMRRPRTRQEWAQIADAIRSADRRQTGGVRGDDAWCKAAVDAYTRLHDTGAHVHLRPGDTPRWHADQRLIRAWLTAPVVPAGDEPVTILQAHGWQDVFHPDRTPDPAELTMLVDVAERAGVVGADGYKASLLRSVQDGITRDDTFVVVLWPAHGPARTSTTIALDELLPPGVSSVDRIVGVLRTVSGMANGLLKPADAATVAAGRQRPPSQQPTGSRHGAPGAGFPPLTGTDIETPPAPPAPPPATPPPRRTR